MSQHTPGEDHHLVESWVRAQDLDWVWFVTFTFRLPAGQDRALRCWRRWVREVAHEMPWSRRQKTRDHVPWIAVVERHRYRDGFHIHALVGGVERLDRAAFQAKWTHGRAEIRQFRPGIGGLAYVLKNIELGAEFIWSRELLTKEHLHR